jgi:8-oxo-dGTP pyrophosphatase MutT (NUDIX family)
VIREAHEEAGVLIDPADLAFSHAVHHRNPEGQPRIGFFFTATRWQGEPVNREPHECAGLHWADPARAPCEHRALHRRGADRHDPWSGGFLPRRLVTPAGQIRRRIGSAPWSSIRGS